MADEDEDISFLRGPSAADIDLTDETQDFRFLSNLSKDDPTKLSLPKRGEKDFEPHSTALQLNVLEASRQAMHDTLSIPRIHQPKTHCLGHYDPETNMVTVQKVKSQHFQTIGRYRNGCEWLLPEEALFMLERGSLDVRWPVPSDEEGGEEGDVATEATADEGEKDKELGVPMSLQGAYATFIGCEAGVGGRLTLEMYTVYTGLKRAGYIVFRAGTWDDDTVSVVPQTTPQTPTWPWGFGFLGEVWRRLAQRTAKAPAQRLGFGPLVGPGLYRSYADIYRLLSIIPSRTHSTPPRLMVPPTTNNPFRLTFDVYKPISKFRKSARPPPDYRIAVVNAREHGVPTLSQLNDLLATVPDDPPREADQLYKKLKHGKRNAILAVVDNGIPSYIRVADACFMDEKLYERIGKGPRGKGGGRGRGGRGRGRGRGR